MKAIIGKNKSINCCVCSPSTINCRVNNSVQTAGSIETPQPINAGSTERGPAGKAGNGIIRIDLTSTVGIVDTYTIYYTNGTTWNYEVKNGTEGTTYYAGQGIDLTNNFISVNFSEVVSTSTTVNGQALSSNISLTASDVNALPDTTTINDLTTTAQQNALNSGATTTNIGQIATNTSNINSLSSTVDSNYNTLNGRITSEVTTLNNTIGQETTNRQNADNNLQSQIDAITSSSDVFDIVGTYADLQAYDITTVPINDIIKVLVDSTHSNAATYYRCTLVNGVKTWVYIGAEGAYYTKSEADNKFVEQTTTVNGKALSTNITLTASDVGALPSSTVIGSGVLTIQKNGSNIDTFNANATSNKSINITVPTDTNDLTNGAGYITGITSSDVTTALGYTPQTELISGTNIKTVNSNSLLGSGNITTPDTKNTAGSTDTSSKIFLVGATSQAVNPQTYSHDTVFVDANGRINSAFPAADANDSTVATTAWVRTAFGAYAKAVEMVLDATLTPIDGVCTWAFPLGWGDGYMDISVFELSSNGTIWTKIYPRIVIEQYYTEINILSESSISNLRALFIQKG